MLIVVLGITMVVTFIIYSYACREYIDILEVFSGVLFGLAAILFFVAVMVLPFCHMGIDGKIASREAEYDSLVYQYENDIYDNDNDLGKRDLMEDIELWNTDLASKKANQDDLWIGIYIPNIYDQFEFIELKGEN